MGRRYGWRYKRKLANKGQYIDKYGYKRFSDSDKLVHRWVAEKYVVKRRLLPWEEVHHKNRNKLDNRARNLEVLEHNQHRRKHFLRLLLTGRK